MIQPIRPETPLPIPGSWEEIPNPGVRLHAAVSLLAHVETVLDGERRRNGRHHALALTGTIHLPELRAEISSRSHDRGGNGNGHGEEQRAIVEIIPRHFAAAIPLQNLAPPAREDSDVWVLTTAPDRDPPWVEHYVGQLAGEQLTFDQYVGLDVTLDLTLTPEEGRNGGGAKVDVTGELCFERSMYMRLLFRDPQQSSAPASESDSDGAALVVAGSCILVPHQTVSSRVGRYSGMTFRVIEDSGRVVCVEQPLVGLVGSVS